MTTEAKIRDFIRENFSFRENAAALDAEASLIESGIIDSAAVLTLVVFLEETFGIKMADDEVRPENMDSVAKLTTYVERKIADAPLET